MQNLPAQFEAVNKAVWRAVNQGILDMVRRQPFLVTNAFFWAGVIMGLIHTS